jgi:hypothetical protein
MIHFACPRCGKHLKVSDDKGGVTVNCPNCRQRLLAHVPEPELQETGKPMIHLSSKTGRDDDRFRSYDRSIEALRATVPVIHQALRPNSPLGDLEGWQAMVQRHDAFREQGSKPVLVATLYGPTGAGKSTLFRLLTGIAVPAGDDVRPVSYACVVAIPDSLAQSGGIERVFPGFQMELLANVEQLRCDRGCTTPVFWVPSSPQGKGEHLPLALADVPDFNSWHQANWAKAEQMMRRAEIVLFVVYREGYADDRVVRELARCCRLAARMAYVLTKTDKPEQASRIWSDLLGKLGAGDTPHAQAFRDLRADGQTLHAFLSRCPVYYSPRTEPSRPLQVQPLTAESPPFASLLCGLDAENILLDGLLQPARRVVQQCRRISGEVAGRITELQHNLELANAAIQQKASWIAGSQFPVGRWMELVLEEARRHQNRLIRVLTKPGYWLRSGVRHIVKGGKRFLDWLGGGEGQEIRQRDELEQERLREATESLLTGWRSQLPQEACEGGLLAQSRLGAIRASLADTSPPEPDTDWEGYVRQAVALWAEEHPWLCNHMPVLPDALALAGIGLVVADLTVTGGVVAATKMASVIIGGKALGVFAAAGAGSTAAGLLLEWANKWKLKNVLREANNRWLSQRSRELGSHLEQHLFQPVFQPWQDQLGQLKAAPIAACLQACDVLEQLGQTRLPAPFRFRSGGLAHSLEELVDLCRLHPEDATWHLCEGHFEPFLRDAGLAPLADHVCQIRTAGQASANRLHSFLEVVRAASTFTQESAQ